MRSILEHIVVAIFSAFLMVSGGAGRGSQNSLPLEFGLGSATVVEELTIRWPNGTVQTRRHLSIDRYHDFTEPASAIRRSGGRRVAPSNQRSVTSDQFHPFPGLSH